MSEDLTGMAVCQDVNFVFWRHIDEHVPEAVAAVADAEVILLETSPLQDKRTRTASEGVLNLILGSELTRQQRGVLAYDLPGLPLSPKEYEGKYEVIKASLPQWLGGLDLGIAEAFHGTQKIVRYLDVNPKDHPDIVDAIKHEFELENEGSDPDSPLHYDFNLYEAFTKRLFQLKGQNIARRDEVIIEQVGNYIDEFTDQSIAITYGTNHSAIAYPFLKQGQARRTFIGYNTATKPFIASLDAQAIRSARFGVEISDELIHRILLKGYLHMNFAREVDPQTSVQDLQRSARVFEPASIQRMDRANKIAARISKDILSEYVQLARVAFSSQSPEEADELCSFVNQVAIS